MATILLAAAVPALPAGATAGVFATWAMSSLAVGAAGAFIDQRFVFPTLFPPDPVEGSRIGDLSLSAAEEGAGWAYAAGPTVRVPCQVIWCSDLIEEKDTSHGGAKGGSGGEFVQYKYGSHVAIGLCEAEQPISRVLKIFADAKTIFDASPDLTVGPSTAIGATAQTSVTLIGAGTFKTNYYLKITAGLSGPDLSIFKSGSVLTVSGFASALNNGEFPVTKAADDLDSSGVKIGTYVKVELAAAGTTVGAGASITLFQKNPQYSKKQMTATPTFHLGGATNEPDELIDAREGGNTPAFRDRAWARLKKLYLFDFGNRIPNFEALVEVQTATTVGDELERVCARAGMASSEYDASTVTDALQGFYTVGNVKGVAALQPLMIAHDVIVREQGERLEFYPRSAAPVVQIDPNDLAVRSGSEKRVDRPCRIFTDSSAFDVPSMVTVRYRDAEKNHQRGSERDRGKPLAKEVQVTIDLNIVMTSSQARGIASRARRLARQRDRMRFRVPAAKYMATVRPGTRCQWTDSDGEFWSVLVDKVDRGANWILECEGRVEDPRNIAGLEVGDAPLAATFEGGSTGTQNRQFTPGAVRMELLDIPALTDAHTTRPGFYAAACYHDERLAFTGAVLYESKDRGTSWQPVHSFVQEAWIGTATSSLAAPATTAVLDWAHTLTVEMSEGELESVSEDECLGGANRATIGYEVIGFVEAVLVAPRTYELSGLLRGLRGTEDRLTHSAGEPFVLLNAKGLDFVEVPLSAVGTTRRYRVVPTGGFLEEAADLEFTIGGRALQPFSPTYVTGTRDGSSNLTISWTRRTRAIHRALSSYGRPLIERDELYDVEILDSGGTTVLRTFSNVATTSQAYSAANQTTDGYTPGDPVVVRIYQRGEFIGRGVAVTETV
ncbi:MAG: hypothetical protein IT459_03925 [Planctomycetes bacterium]|nr:hypothetical protein [Planctomycetota bacterium]